MESVVQPSLSKKSFTAQSRLVRLDMLRAVALLGMICYHFGWNLAFFGYLAPGTATRGGWAFLAHVVAGSFLFIVGFSLYLAHGQRFQGYCFALRQIKICAAAALVSGITWIIFPNLFVYFGILHHIALASFIGLIFLRLPLWGNVMIALVVLLLPFYWRPLVSPFWAPLGLNAAPPSSLDYVPLFPWFSAVVLGISCARVMQHHGLLFLLEGEIRPRFPNKLLQWAGRHSLFVYLIHQPLLWGALYLLTSIFVEW